MKIFLLAFFIFPSLLFAQTGKVFDNLSLKSSILNMERKYAIYLPPDYESSQRRYPVLYLLHGGGDDQTGWVQFGEVNRYADKAIAEGTIPPMIIVMPDADSSFYINSYDGKEKYEDFFVKEFIPAVENVWRIKNQKRFRGIAGLSMGGYGTMIYALKHPDLFDAAAPLSAAFLGDDDITNFPEESWQRTFAQLYGRNLKGKDRLTKNLV